MNWVGARRSSPAAILLLAIVVGGAASCSKSQDGRRGDTGNPQRALATHFTHKRLAHGEKCPVTRPSDRMERPPAGLRAAVDHDILQYAYGHGPIWVLLPQGRRNSVHDPGGVVGTKVAWYVGVTGPLDAVGRRLDARSRIPGRLTIADPNNDAPRIEPSRLVLPSEGCWEIAGGVGSDVLVWVYRARAARR